MFPSVKCGGDEKNKEKKAKNLCGKRIYGQVIDEERPGEPRQKNETTRWAHRREYNLTYRRCKGGWPQAGRGRGDIGETQKRFSDRRQEDRKTRARPTSKGVLDWEGKGESPHLWGSGI